MIVLADANLQNAISGALWGGFANAGQTCSGIERVYVDSARGRPLRRGRGRRRAAAARGRPDGLGHRDRPDGLARSSSSWSRSSWTTPSRTAPSCTAAGPTEVAGSGRLLRAGRAHGRDARHAHHARGDLRPRGPDHRGGSARRRRSAWPTTREFGLGASVWTLDRARGERIARRHRVGHGLDQRPHVLARRVPVRVGRREELRARPLALEVRLLRVREHQAARPGSRRCTRNFWWHPYDESLGRAIDASAKLLYGRDDDKLKALREGAQPLLKVGAKTLPRRLPPLARRAS